MSTRNWTLGGFGLAVAALAALSVTACDPYIAANTAAPVVLGVSLVDTNYNEIIQPDSTGCGAPYPQVNETWANQAFPGLCNPSNIDFGIPSVCPVLCYPPRTGPGYAPLFMGNLGGTYQTNLPGALTNFTYALPDSARPGRYVLGEFRPVPTYYLDYAGDEFVYGQIRILFNKLMDPQSIQPDPLRCVPPTGATAIKVTLGGVDVTSTHSVCYIPNSDTEYWGGSLTVTGPRGALVANSTYRVVGQVSDQGGATLDVDVTVNTGDDVIDAPAGLTYATSPATYQVGTAITPNEPSSTGGIVLAYSVTPALPAGLAISRTTGIISGTPTAAAATTTYTVTAANGADSTTFPLVITVTP